MIKTALSRRLLLVASVGFFAAFGLSSEDTLAADDLATLTFGIAWHNPTTPVLTDATGYAIQLGLAEPILKKHGFKLAPPVPFNSGPLSVAGLNSGQVDAVLTGVVSAAVAKSNGQAIRPVTIGKPWGDLYLVGAKGNSESLESLIGKKVGTPFGSDWDQWVRVLLQEKGLTGKVELINVAPSDALASLLSGSVGAVVRTADNAITWKEGNADLLFLAKASEGKPIELVTNTIISSDDYVAKHPKLQAALWDVQQAGIAAVRKDEEAYYRFYAENAGISVDAAKANRPKLLFDDKPVSDVGVEALNLATSFLYDAKIIPNKVSVKGWVVGID